MAATGAKSSQENTQAGAEAGDIRADIEQLRKDIGQLSEHLLETGNRSMSRARQAASDSADQLRGTASDLQDDLTETVREKPFTALAVAAGVGFLVAMMMRR